VTALVRRAAALIVAALAAGCMAGRGGGGASPTETPPRTGPGGAGSPGAATPVVAPADDRPGAHAAPGISRGELPRAAGDTAPWTGPPIGRAAVDALRYPELRFDPPEAERFTLSNGVPVFFMEDHSLPLVDVIAFFRGGSSHFDRSDFAAATAVASSLLLSAGTASLPPDSVDKLVDTYALTPAIGTGGTGSFAAIGSLTRNFDLALGLLAEMLRAPRFDRDRVETWRLRELETVKRLRDSPGNVAISEFNRLMFGDHPIGWIMEPADLEPDRLSDERLRRVHREIFCREHLVLGVVGDLTREEAEAKLEAAFGTWPACPRELDRPPDPVIRSAGGVLVIHKEVNQSTIVMGQPGGVLMRDDPEYYASQVANWILGGAGFSSRLLSRLRTEEGLAYSASTVWGAGTRHQRIFGAITHTKGESTIAAARQVREVLEEAMRDPPTEAEVRLAIDNTVNGFVFAFERPADVVSRQMSYRAAGLPEDWLERYLSGVQRVTPGAVRDVLRRHLRPDSMTIVIVGDTTRFDASPAELGPILPR